MLLAFCKHGLLLLPLKICKANLIWLLHPNTHEEVGFQVVCNTVQRINYIFLSLQNVNFIDISKCMPYFVILPIK